MIPRYSITWDDREYPVEDMFVFTTTWTGRFPGGVEGCAECHAPLEVVPGQRRVGAFRLHLGEPDLFCDACVARERPDLVDQDVIG